MLAVGGEGVVIKGDFFDTRNIFHYPLHFLVDILGATDTHGSAGEGLRPEAVYAFGRTAAAGVNRYIGMLEMGDDILIDRQVPHVDLTGKRQCIQVLDRRTIRSTDSFAVHDEGDAVNFLPGPALAQLLCGVVEFSAADQVHSACRKLERFLRQDRDMGTGQDGYGRGFLRLIRRAVSTSMASVGVEVYITTMS